MQKYEEVRIEIVFFQMDDIVTASPGGIEYGKDEDSGDLGWG